MYLGSDIIEDARREFLDECDFVLKLPTAIILNDSTEELLSKNVICLPRYFCFGIKENNGDFEIEERCIKSNLNIESVYDLKESDWEIPGNRHLLSLKSLYISIVEDHPVVSLFKFKESTYERFFQCKFKIWSDIPKKSYLFYPEFTALAIILYLFENNISSEKFNLYKETYKNIIKREKIKCNIINIPKAVKRKLNELEKRACLVFEEIMMLPFFFNMGFNERAAAFYLLLGELFPDTDQSQKDAPEMMRFELPSAGQKSLDEDFTSIFALFMSSKGYATPEEYIAYINEAIKNNKIKIDFYGGMLQKVNIAVVHLEAKPEDFFGSVFTKFFPENLSSFELTTEKKIIETPLLTVSEYEGFSKNIPVRISYMAPHLVIRGPYSVLKNMTKMIIESDKGWVQFIDYSIAWEKEGGATFINETEFKLSYSPIRRGRKI